MSLPPVTLDGRAWTSPQAAHAAIAAALGFPGWYGGNLDALSDCLSMQDGRQVRLAGMAAAARALGPYLDRLLRVFRDAAAEGWIVFEAGD